MRRTFASLLAACVTVPAAVIALGLSTQAPAAGAGGHRHVFPLQGCHYSYSDYHHDDPATDIMAPVGCRFVAPVSGYVHEVSRRDRWDPAVNKGSTRGGRFVSIIGDDGVRYYGSHLEHVNRLIHRGVRVSAGQVLGRVGRSGDARGGPSHLHFGVSWKTPRGIWWVRRGEVWPWPYLDAWRSGHHYRSPRKAVEAKRERVGTVPPCRVDC
jgi:murein DD-endopeptidase MepM/ murein hydrolase activator NlpD